MLRKGILFLVIVLIYNPLVKAQEDFKPSGKVLARGFFDYSAGLGQANKTSGFDIKRALLGYEYQITPTIKAQLSIDGASGKTSSGKYEVALRNAFISWTDYGFEIMVGQIGLLQFNTQEKYWNHRHVMKSFQDEYKMSPSVDLGVSARYKFNSFLSADFTIVNGEGYKNVSKNNSNKYALGISVRPFENFEFRAFGSIYSDSEDVREGAPEGSVDLKYKSQNTLSLFTGYQTKRFSAGAEYNYMFNKGFVSGKDYYGYSAYSSLQLAPKWRAFARYDWVGSKTPSNFSEAWSDIDGNLMMGGVEFSPVKQLKIAPNLRHMNPTNRKSETYIFVNLEFNL